MHTLLYQGTLYYTKVQLGVVVDMFESIFRQIGTAGGIMANKRDNGRRLGVADFVEELEIFQKIYTNHDENNKYNKMPKTWSY